MIKFKFNIEDILYIIPLFIVSFLSLFSISDLVHISEKTRDVFNVIACLLFCIKIIKTKYSLKEGIFFGLFLLLCLLSYLELKLSLFLFLGLAVFAIKNVDIKKIVIVDICFKAVFLFIHFMAFILNYIGIIELNEITRFEFGDLRHSIFLRTPHNFMALLFWLIIEINYLLKDKKKVLIINALFFLFSIFIFKFTYAKTPFLITIIYMCVNIFLLFGKDKKVVKIVIDYVTKYIFMILAIIWLLLMIYSSKYGVQGSFITASINKLLSTRLFLSTNAFIKYGVSFLSENVVLDYISLTFLDSLYPMLYIKYGSIYIFIISIMFFKIPKFKYYEEKIIFIMFAIYACSEHFVFNIGMCIALLCIVSVYYKEKNERNMSLCNQEIK